MRPPTGTIEQHRWRDGRTVTWRLRVPLNGERVRVKLGTNHEGWNRERAEVELERIMGQVERGTWEAPPANAATAPPNDGAETLLETLSRWWLQRQAEPMAPKTRKDILWRLTFLQAYAPDRVRTSAIDARWVDGFKSWLTEQESKQDGKPLSPRSINMVLSQLATVLDLAVEDRLLPSNPARGRRRRMPERGARRAWLEPDMVVDLLDAAGKWEAEVPEHQRYGRRAVLATLCLAGLRISELTEARRRSLDIHAGTLRVAKAKTPSGERDVELSAFLLGELRPHLAAVASRVRVPIGPDLPIFPTLNGGALNQSNIRTRLIAECVKRANEKRAKEDRLLLPERLTPHALRRTYASLCFLAGRDPRWVMAQLGHKQPALVLEIYAQTMQRQRVDRELVWTMMAFRDETEDSGNSPTKSPLNGSGGVRPGWEDHG